MASFFGATLYIAPANTRFPTITLYVLQSPQCRYYHVQSELFSHLKTDSTILFRYGFEIFFQIRVWVNMVESVLTSENSYIITADKRVIFCCIQ